MLRGHRHGLTRTLRFTRGVVGHKCQEEIIQGSGTSSAHCHAWLVWSLVPNHSPLVTAGSDSLSTELGVILEHCEV